MIVNGNEFNSIAEAFELLPEDVREHSRRVAEYSQIALKKIAAMALYVADPKADRQLIKENAKLAYLAGLYHDIGKVDVYMELAQDHTESGEQIFEALSGDFAEYLSAQRRLIRDGIVDHHERMNGLGGPTEKKARDISYFGRIVAIADMLDNLAVNITSEDPIADALKDMKQSVDAGFFDEEFFKAFKACRAALKKVFAGDDGENLPIPETHPWIKRKANRPMQLVWKTFEHEGKPMWGAEMRFRGTKENDLSYEDVKKIIKQSKLGLQLTEYFVYEAADALGRFNACSVDTLGGFAMVLPSAGFNYAGMTKRIEQALSDEGFSKDSVLFGIPEDVLNNPSKNAEKNIAQCKEAGIDLMNGNDLEMEMMISAEDFLTEDTIVFSAIRQLQKEAREENQG